MKTCPACGEKIKDDALRCKHCGSDLPVRRCPWCAEIIDDDAKKCKHCKSYIDKIRCDGCGRHVEQTEMRCPDCIHEIVAQQVMVELEKTAFRAKLERNVLAGLTIAALLWAIFF